MDRLLEKLKIFFTLFILVIIFWITIFGEKKPAPAKKEVVPEKGKYVQKKTDVSEKIEEHIRGKKVITEQVREYLREKVSKLDSQNPKEIVSAIEAFVEYDAREYAPYIVPLLMQEEWTVSGKAKWALLEFKAVEQAAAIAELLDQEQELGYRTEDLIGILAELGAVGSAPKIAKFIKSPITKNFFSDRNIKQAIIALNRLGVIHDYKNDLIKLLEKENDDLSADVRAAVIVSLRDVNTDDSVSQIIERYLSDTRECRIVTGRVKNLFGGYNLETLTTIRQEAAITLKYMRYPGFDITLYKASKKDLFSADPLEIIIAADKLGALKNKEAVPRLIELLKNEDATIRISAVFALKNINDTRAVEPLIDALEDSHPEIRKIAALALGSLEDGRAYSALTKAQADEAKEVREAAVWALTKINKP